MICTLLSLKALEGNATITGFDLLTAERSMTLWPIVNREAANIYRYTSLTTSEATTS